MGESRRLLLEIAGIGMLVACSALSGCGWQEGVAGGEAESIELRTYRVPPARQEELIEMLYEALGMGTEAPIGRAAKGPGGSLLISAPYRIHAGLEEVMSADFDPIQASRPVTLTYWFLAGRPLDNVEGSATSSVVGRQVPVLEPVLQTIADAQGSTEFALLEQFQLSALNRHSYAVGRLGRVTQSAARSGDQVVANVQAAVAGHEFYSRIVLEKGQFLVLGYVGLDKRNLEESLRNEFEDFSTLYCVMTADFAP